MSSSGSGFVWMNPASGSLVEREGIYQIFGGEGIWQPLVYGCIEQASSRLQYSAGATPDRKIARARKLKTGRLIEVGNSCAGVKLKEDRGTIRFPCP
jgi:hypothetical protein